MGCETSVETAEFNINGKNGEIDLQSFEQKSVESQKRGKEWSRKSSEKEKKSCSDMKRKRQKSGVGRVAKMKESHQRKGSRVNALPIQLESLLWEDLFSVIFTFLSDGDLYPLMTLCKRMLEIVKKRAVFRNRYGLCEGTTLEPVLHLSGLRAPEWKGVVNVMGEFFFSKLIVNVNLNVKMKQFLRQRFLRKVWIDDFRILTMRDSEDRFHFPMLERVYPYCRTPCTCTNLPASLCEFLTTYPSRVSTNLFVLGNHPIQPAQRRARQEANRAACDDCWKAFSTRDVEKILSVGKFDEVLIPTKYFYARYSTDDLFSKLTAKSVALTIRKKTGDWEQRPLWRVVGTGGGGEDAEELGNLKRNVDALSLNSTIEELRFTYHAIYASLNFYTWDIKLYESQNLEWLGDSTFNSVLARLSSCSRSGSGSFRNLKRVDFNDIFDVSDEYFERTIIELAKRDTIESIRVRPRVRPNNLPIGGGVSTFERFILSIQAVCNFVRPRTYENVEVIRKKVEFYFHRSDFFWYFEISIAEEEANWRFKRLDALKHKPIVFYIQRLFRPSRSRSHPASNSSIFSQHWTFRKVDRECERDCIKGMNMWYYYEMRRHRERRNME